MRLKRLEIVGFKSFASRVKLEFDQGITAIVGPNGSGKSNISDAVRWVLGEQSARSLRGTKMEDIIFAGADGKKALGMAEVQLTLENSDDFLPVDYHELTIARRVYRSGESEFFINKQPCRLRDIHDLFTDTGLGKEGFAVIGQGQIDTVLSVRSQDRRVLLEETAGIIKYRHRKEEAIAKIEHTEQDLIRITDILGELQKREEPLRLEAEAAREYQRLAEQLNDCELDNYCLLLNELDHKFSIIDETKLRQEQIVTQLGAAHQEMEEKLQSLQGELSEIENQIDNTQNHQLEVAERLNKANQDKELTIERLKHNLGRQTEIESTCQTSQERALELSEGVQALQEELKRYALELSMAKERLAEEEAQAAQVKRNYSEKREVLENAKSDFLEFMREFAECRNLVRQYEQEQSSFLNQLTTLESDQAKLNGKITDITYQLERAKTRLGDLLTEQERITNSGQELAAQRNELEQEKKSVSKVRESISAKYQNDNSRLKALRDLEADYEGFHYSVRRLFQDKPQGVNLLGAVSDLIKVPVGLEVAFEVALGSALQYVVVPTQEDGKGAIDWLKRQKSGRATFLPLDSLKFSEFPESYQKHWTMPGVLGPAHKLLDYDSRFHPAIASLLGRVAITEDLDSAIALQKALPSFGRIVTKSGEIISPSGAMTGGSISSKNSGILSRKNEITKLRNGCQSLMQDLDIQRSKEDEIAEQIGELEEKQASLREQATRIGLAVQSEQKDIQQLEKENKACLNELKTIEEHISRIAISLTGTKQNIDVAKSSLVEFEAAEHKRRETIKALELKIAELEQSQGTFFDSLTEAKVHLAETSTTYQNVQDKLKSAEDLLKGEIQRLTNMEGELKELAAKQEQLRLKEEEYISISEKFQEERRQTGKHLEHLRERRNDIQSSYLERSNGFKQMRASFSQAEKNLHQSELELNRITLEMQRIIDDLAVREVIPERVISRNVVRSSSQLKKEINELRGQIRELGLVNPKSIEEYDLVRERCHFLTEQISDLTEAKKSLQSVISEMDAISAKQFSEAFQKVRQAFQELFSRLFGGGKADLILTEPDALLTTGVEVIAQPPGKKLQNLLLLSGGERALTAIALLFAIRKVKPVPFCVLDEIDAALDDANLDRFVHMMKDFSDEIQFLIITHRQGTMEVADSLYGITMSETAVSQLISVRMN